jgi:hypothetical protein
VKSIVAETLGGELIQVGSWNWSTKSSRLPKAQIVEQNYDNIGGSLWGTDRLGKIFLRILEGLPDCPVELGIRKRKLRAVLCEGTGSSETQKDHQGYWYSAGV